jgi:hypothetical protein
VKFLFITNKYGDLGNRLFRFSRIYSVLHALPVFIIDLSFYQYAHFYSPKSLKYWITFRILGLIKSKKLFVNIVEFIKSCRFIREVEFADASNSEWNSQKTDQIYELITKTKNIFLKIECSELYSEISYCNSEIKKEINRIFHVKKRYFKIAATIVKKNPQILYLGVHIRRGDFKEFWNGQWFFDDEVYIKNFTNLLETYNGRQTIRVVIVSNESLNINRFMNLNCIYSPQSTPVVDQEILKQCDAILGVWSTFAAWPAFLNNIPFALVQREDLLSWNKFSKLSEYIWIHSGQFQK